MSITIFCIVIAAALLATACFVLVLPQSRPVDERCERLMAQIPSDQLDSIEPFAEKVESIVSADREFVAASQGLRGSLHRVRLSDTYLQLVWVMFSKGFLDAEDAGYVWRMAAAQLGYTFLALPEAVLCSIFRRLPHFFLYLSFDAYRSIVMRCEVAFAQPNAPKCVSSLRNLL